MDKRKVRKFKNQQNRLAQKIAKAHNSSTFELDYEQKIPNVFMNEQNEEWIICNHSQIVFPTRVIYKGTNRVIVVMRFNGICKSRTIGKILKRQFSINETENGFEVRSSFAPCTIGKL